MRNTAIADLSLNEQPDLLSGTGWQKVLNLLPDGWEQAAWDKNAVKKQPTSFNNSVVNLLRCFLMYGACGLSLRSTSALAREANLGTFSPKTLRKRLMEAGDWLDWICNQLINESAASRLNTKSDLGDIPFKIVDGSVISGPGTSENIRLHYEYNPVSHSPSSFALTETVGKGVGESCKHFNQIHGDHICLDAGYCKGSEFSYSNSIGTKLLVRLNHQNLRLQSLDGKPFPLLKNIKSLTKESKYAEYPALVKLKTEEIPVRVCIFKKDEAQAQIARKKKLKKASKNQTKTKDITLELCGYIVLITTFGKEFSVELLFRIYRTRWQIELEFKRLKSIFNLGDPPTIEPYLTKIWILLQFLAKLICDKFALQNGAFSP